jgi:hypothetical protein
VGKKHSVNIKKETNISRNAPSFETSSQVNFGNIKYHDVPTAVSYLSNCNIGHLKLCFLGQSGAVISLLFIRT